MVEKLLNKLEQFVLGNKALLVVLILTFIIRLPSLLEPLWNLNESIFLVAAQQMNRGANLYTDIFVDGSAGIYYLASWSLKFLGQTVWSFKFLLAVWMIPTLTIFYFLAKKLFDKRAAIFSVLILALLTSTPLFEGNIVNSEILMILPISLAFLFGLNKRYFFAGF